MTPETILDRLRAIVAYLDRASRNRVFSWVTHGLLALPLVWVAALAPWTAPGLVFLYREGEQVLHRIKDRTPLDPLDHIMDVLVPALVGWFLLR